jgi:hypothetical protein
LSQDILLQVLFHESSSPKPLKVTEGSLQIFLKICGDIRKSMCINSINDPGGKFSTGINDTGGNFCHQYHTVVDIGGKFAISVNNTCNKFDALVNNNGGK